MALHGGICRNANSSSPILPRTLVGILTHQLKHADARQPLKMQKNELVMAPNTMFLIMAHRGGDAELHSYPVGIATSFEIATTIAEEAEVYRGGKYACSIWEFVVNCADMDIEPEILKPVTPVAGWKTAAQRLLDELERDKEIESLRLENQQLKKRLNLL